MKKLKIKNNTIEISDYILHKKININSKIRLSINNDVDFIFNIDQKSFKESDFDIMYTKFDFMRMINDNQHLLFIYENQKTVIGYISIKFEIDNCYLESLAVLPEFRNQHIGSELIKNLFLFCKYYKISNIYIYTKEYLIPFYLKLGFIIKNVIKHKYKSGEDSYVLIKKL